jgi:uncharacterized protein (TIGR03437 family)
MNRLVALSILFSCGRLFSQEPPQIPQARWLDNLPLRFETNQGQAPPAVKFLARGRGYSLSLTAFGSVLSLPGAEIQTKLAGAHPRTKLEGLDALPGATNYLHDSDPATWQTGIRNYARVRYTQVYSGIDLVFYGAGGLLEYDFVVQPGADPAAIALDIQGARAIRVDGRGDLVLDTPAGEVRWRQPVIYQNRRGAREPVNGRFVLHGRRVRFEIAAYDRARPVVIDPALGYSTFLGGKGNEGCRGIALDASGNVYLAGYTNSSNLPGTGGSVQPAYAGGTNNFETGDAFVAKFNPRGGLVYVTYLGGSFDDFALGIAADAAGNAFVTGFTNSSNFPTTRGAYQPTHQGPAGPGRPAYDAFVAKLNPSGSALIYSTFLGGSDGDRGLAIAIDTAGNAYIAGDTLSANFPTSTGAFQTAYKGTGGMPPLCGTCGPFIVTGDGFVAKLDPTGGKLLFSTLLGGSNDDTPLSIAVDSAANVYVSGATLSSDFPVTPGAFQTAFHGVADFNFQPVIKLGDGFVTKLNSTGTALLYSTFLGGSRDDAVFGMTVDSTGAAYLTGATSSPDFPVTSSAPQRAYRGPNAGNASGFVFGDAFAAKLNPQGSALVYSTYLGGSSDDAGWAIAVDPTGAAYIAGLTASRDFPLSPDALQKSYGGGGGQEFTSGDGFLIKLDAAGSSLLYSSFLGGNMDDAVAAFVLDSSGNGYLTGNTLSQNFPLTSTAAQRAYGGEDDNYSGLIGDTFLTKITGLFVPPVQPPPPTLTSVLNGASLQSGAVSPGEIVVIAGAGMGPATAAGQQIDTATGSLANTLSGARILFDGLPAPLISVSDQQSIAIVPYEVVGNPSTQVQVEYQGLRSAPLTLTVADAAPGLFSADMTGTGQGEIYNADGTPNSADNPAPAEATIMVFGTGEGQTDPPGVDGKIATDVTPTPLLGPPSVTIGGMPAQVLSAAGALNQVAGRFQIAVQVPDGVSSGDQEIIVTLGQFQSQPGITVAIQ